MKVYGTVALRVTVLLWLCALGSLCNARVCALGKRAGKQVT